MDQANKELLLTVYGALLILGGGMGYAKKQSIPSLVAGSGSGLLILLLTKTNGGLASNQTYLQYITGLLCLIMSFRTIKSGKFMPAGMVAILSGLTFGAISQ